MALLGKNAFIVCSVFSLWVNAIILQGCWRKSFCWGSSSNVNLAVVLFFVFFFSFSHEINHLLLCFWFPGSWLVLPGQNLNTAPLFSPQEQCLNVESIPILTEDAQNWIWVEVGSYDAWGGRRGKPKKTKPYPKWLAILLTASKRPQDTERDSSASPDRFWALVVKVSYSLQHYKIASHLGLVFSQWPCSLSVSLQRATRQRWIFPCLP